MNINILVLKNKHNDMGSKMCISHSEHEIHIRQ